MGPMDVASPLSLEAGQRMSLRERPVPWCLTHDSAGSRIPEQGCFAASTGHGNPADCVHADFVLRPLDALVIEKIDGKWPEWAVDILGYDVAALAECRPTEILDALTVRGSAE